MKKWLGLKIIWLYLFSSWWANMSMALIFIITMILCMFTLDWVHMIIVGSVIIGVCSLIIVLGILVYIKRYFKYKKDKIPFKW